jgi:hypothetical protein
MKTQKIIFAILKKDDRWFAVVHVRPEVSLTVEADGILKELSKRVVALQGSPLVLARQDATGHYSYAGDRAFADYVASLPPHEIGWQEMTFQLRDV